MVEGLVDDAVAHEVKPTLEGFDVQAVGPRDEQLADHGHRRPGRGAHVGAVGIDRQLTPADQRHVFFFQFALEGLDAEVALRVVGGQKQVAHGVGLGRRQAEAGIQGGDLLKQRVGNRREDAGAVAGVLLAAAGAAVVHAVQHLQRVGHHRVRGHAFELGDEADAAVVFLVRRVVETVRFGEVTQGRGGGAGRIGHEVAPERGDFLLDFFFGTFGGLGLRDFG